jgi:transcriptional regulator with XRE-family HTH domain
MELREARFRRNMTQQRLMLTTGISQALLSAYERGIYTPDERRKARIAEALNVPVEELEFREPQSPA